MDGDGAAGRLTQVQASRLEQGALLLRPADRKLNERKANGHGILNSGEPTLHIGVTDESARGCGHNWQVRGCAADWSSVSRIVNVVRAPFVTGRYRLRRIDVDICGV